jgi:hypothetical protein
MNWKCECNGCICYVHDDGTTTPVECPMGEYANWINIDADTYSIDEKMEGM